VRTAGRLENLEANRGRSTSLHVAGPSLAACLAGLRRTLGAFAADFDPSLVTSAEASVVADEAVKIQSIASVVKDFAMSRAGRTRV
jgi:hypothetical protein